jgi:hypothetical protein
MIWMFLYHHGADIVSVIMLILIIWIAIASRKKQRYVK